MTRNNGFFLEQLVQLIEQSLSPESAVLRNVKLPIIGSASGKTAQCDVIIRTGRAPRETVTIVEVQDRTSRVTINDFRGWMKKMKDVGAQHLYCVSRHPFPQSIKEQAALSGHTVKLMTIASLETDKIPLEFFDVVFVFHELNEDSTIAPSTVSFPTLQGPWNDSKKMLVMQDFLEITSAEQRFSFDGHQLFSLASLLINSFPHEAQARSLTRQVSFGYDRPFFFYYGNKEFIPIQLQADFSWKTTPMETPFTVLSYSQNDHGTLAWILECFHDSSSGPTWIKIPIIKNEQGYVLGQPYANAKEDSFTSYRYKLTPMNTNIKS